ncbi:MAG: DUF342 domain-containing protein [Deltaproteobacteria bacterium]|nr:DUF342 domain-containing protein [Deltaproteobacteria bacterium]TLN04182.1 MAG: DUF342 domain-containing protein [bacterium]
MPLTNPQETDMIQDVEPGCGLSFTLDKNGKQLLVAHETGVTGEPINKDHLTQILANEGFADLFLFPEAVDKMLSSYNSGAGFSMVLGERRDGSFAISIDTDQMSAHLTITPAYGGKPVTTSQIYSKLQEEGICFGIRNETIDAAVAKGYARNKLVAEGIQPVQGDDAQFISLLPEAKNSRLYADELEIVDYRNFGNITTVKQGEPLMRRLRPTDGKDGTNILGLPVPAARGNDSDFSGMISGAEIHPDDPDLLISSIAGQPFLVKNGVKIEPVITIKNVDLSTGNLDIEGSLTISGDVQPGMKVKATADIVIEGMVEAAHIEAGGDIEVKGAVIGQGPPRTNGEDLNPAAATVHAEGSVKALFVENAIISSGGTIEISEFVMNSELNAGKSILVGEPGSSKGRIISSLCRATERIEAIAIGSWSGAGTVLEVGVDPKVHEKFTLVKQSLHAKEREQMEAERALEYYRDKPNGATLEEIKQKEIVLRDLQTDIQELTGQLRRLKRRFNLLDNAAIKAERQVYCGVKISIGEKSLLLEKDLDAATFTLGEHGIQY